MNPQGYWQVFEQTVNRAVQGALITQGSQLLDYCPNQQPEPDNDPLHPPQTTLNAQ
jgi:hypothetical protein